MLSYLITQLLSAPIASAQEAAQLENPLPVSTLPELVGLVIRGLLGIVGSVALAMFVYGAFLLVLNQGQQARITKGKNTMIWAIFGLGIIFLAYAVTNFIVRAFTEVGAS